MKQIHMRYTFIPLRGKYLTEEQRNTILESHIFLKDNRYVNLTGRMVAGGNKHIYLISKEDAISPTVATESVVLTCILDSEEHQHVATLDILNAFIHNSIKDEKHMAIIKIRGVLVDILM